MCDAEDAADLLDDFAFMAALGDDNGTRLLIAAIDHFLAVRS
jgi:hypothetical protein